MVKSRTEPGVTGPPVTGPVGIVGPVGPVGWVGVPGSTGVGGGALAVPASKARQCGAQAASNCRTWLRFFANARPG